MRCVLVFFGVFAVCSLANAQQKADKSSDKELQALLRKHYAAIGQDAIDTISGLYSTIFQRDFSETDTIVSESVRAQHRDGHCYLDHTYQGTRFRAWITPNRAASLRGDDLKDLQVIELDDSLKKRFIYEYFSFHRYLASPLSPNMLKDADEYGLVDKISSFDNVEGTFVYVRRRDMLHSYLIRKDNYLIDRELVSDIKAGKVISMIVYFDWTPFNGWMLPKMAKDQDGNKVITEMRFTYSSDIPAGTFVIPGN